MATKRDAKVSAVPEGHRSLAPYLVVRRASKAIDFYARVFGARELFRMGGPQGRIMHAEMQIGDSILMLADENPERGTRAPEGNGASPASVFLYISDVDAVFAKAKAAGAKVQSPPADMFWGDRFGQLTDPFGHNWGIATHVEDVSPKEMEARMAAQAPR